MLLNNIRNGWAWRSSSRHCVWAKRVPATPIGA